MNTYTILAFMEDKPGVLNKISMLLRRKMYNIDSLTVCKTETQNVSRMTITLTSDNPEKVSQIVKQVQKIVEVITVKTLDPEKSFWREVAIIKCNLMPSKLEYIKRNYATEILSESDTESIIQVAGTTRKIDACIGEITMKNIKEIARSGVTAMEDIGNDPEYKTETFVDKSDRV